MVKTGYKQTEVGEIPEDWDVRTIGELASVGSGGTPNRGNASYWNGNIPWITTALINGGEIEEASEFISESGLNNSAAKVYKKNTLLMAMYGQGKTRGKIAILSFDAAINQACAAIVANSAVLPNFLLHNLNSQYLKIRELSNSGGQENLSSGIVKSILVSVPNRLEQKAIADALSDVDALISALEKLVAKKRDMKTAAMQQLLTGKKRLPGFGEGGGLKQTELGKIPSNWAITRLNDVISEISMGPFGSDITVANFRKEGVPVLSGDNIKTNRLHDSFTNYVTPEKAKSLKKAVARRGDVIVTHRGTLGQIAFIPNDSQFERYVISQSQFRVRFNKELNPNWVALYFLSRKGSDALLEGKGHTGVPALAQATTTFRKLLMPLPPTEEQSAIVGILSEMANEISALERRLNKTKAIKHGMMQELLTGRTRLV